MVPITFMASIPTFKSAIQIGMDETRLQLNIPANEIGAIDQLRQLHGKVLSIAIVVVVEGKEQDHGSSFYRD